MEEGKMDAVFFAVYVGQGPLNPEGYRHARQTALGKYADIHRALREDFGDRMELALHADDVGRILDSGKKAAIIGMENGYPIGEDLSSIAMFYERGCRYITLCHNGHNQICDSQQNAGGPAEKYGGVSAFGEKAIAEMNRLGIIVDVSHLSKKAMMDAVRLSRAPVIASHASCRALCDVSRNLDDEQLLALKDSGGVIHIVGISDFIKADPPEKRAAVLKIRKETGLPSGDAAFTKAYFTLSEDIRTAYHEKMDRIEATWPKADVRDLIDHVDHAVGLMGIDHVGLSSDFYENRYTVTGWPDVGESVAVTRELVRRGYGEEDIAKLWSGNLLRVWRCVEEVAAGL
jgi:membrane dipeptidase